MIFSNIFKSSINNNIDNDISALNSLPTSLPSIIDLDINGNLFQSSDFKNKILLILFIKDDISYINNNNILISYNNLKIIIITPKSDDIESNIKNYHNVIILSNNYSKYLSLFKASKCCDSFYLYDANGVLIYEDLLFNNKDIIKILLNKYVKNKLFNIRYYVDRNIGYSNEIFINQIYDYMDITKSDYYLAVLMTSVCSSCMSGKILYKLNDYANIENKNNR